MTLASAWGNNVGSVDSMRGGVGAEWLVGENVNPVFAREKGTALDSSIPAWRIPWAEEPGGLQSTGSQRVIHK